MILVFGGTTEGKKVMATLDELKRPYVYSTKTRIDFKPSEFAIYRHGALDENTLRYVLQDQQISTVIDAAHPFAEVLHSTVARVCEKLQIPAVRLERPQVSRVVNPLVKYVDDYEEALRELSANHKTKTLLALTGVQTIERLRQWWANNPTYFRILDRSSSKAIASKSQFPYEQLIFGLPSDDLEKEKALIQTKEIDVILTKESGDSGFLLTKIQSALLTNSSIIIIKQPKTPNYFNIIFAASELSPFLISKKELI